MSALLLAIYRFFHNHRLIFFLFLAIVLGFILLFASKIRLEENITGLTARSNSMTRDEYVIRNFKFADKLIVHLFLNDTAAPADPDYLVTTAGKLRDSLLSSLDSTYIKQILLRVNDTLFNNARNIIDEHLPLFLTEADYKTIDSLIQPEYLESKLRSNYRMMIMPTGMLFRENIIKDPLGISGLAFKKLSSLQQDDQYTLYDGCVFSKDKKHLLMFITPANLSSETKKNSIVIATIERFSSLQDTGKPGAVSIEYFGYAASSVSNASQVKHDMILTLGIATILIFLFISWYFRNLLVPLLGFVPAVFGGGLSLAIIYLLKGNVSFIALGIGSVILGLIIDYTLYIVNHYRKKQSAEQVITDMSQTIFICALTTIGVFLCLIFLNSAVLHDLGLFTAISVFGASVCSVVILPQFLGKQLLPKEKEKTRITFVDRIAAIDFGKKRWLLTGIALAGVVSLFISNKATFEKDLNSMNYMTAKLKTAEKHLDQISTTLKSVYIVSTGKNLEDALKSNRIVQSGLESLKQQGKIHYYSGVGSMLPSDTEQKERLETWNQFWTPERQSLLLSSLEKSGKKIGFKESAFSGTRAMLNRDYSLLSPGQIKMLRSDLFSDWINETPEMTMISGIAKVAQSEKENVYKQFAADHNLVVFDRQNLATRFVEHVNHDFELLVTLSMVFVSLLILLSFGRIELAFITSLPMFLSWIITLGFMGITGIRFNIFNIIISTFIFGLGVDYSILMMRGLTSWYKTGVDDMKTYRVSILLSSTTTLIGVGALFFAKHPALNSIALISVFGIISVVLISLSFQSMLARWFFLSAHKTGRHPLTAFTILFSIFIAWIPISLIAFILVIYSRIISPLLPLNKKRKQYVFHWLFNFLSRLYIILNFPRFHKVENEPGESFENPGIIICNHQSLIETPAMLRLHPKIVILTNDWVFHHWVFGPVAKVAGFIPVNENIDDSLSLIKERIKEGYSVLIFPEGHRSKDGQVQRFHKGAFYIAEKLNLDIIPVMIFGSGGFLPRGTFWGKPNRLFMQIMPRIQPGDLSFGNTYSERAKQVRRYYREEYNRFSTLHNTAGYNALNLRLNYLYKGPVLEWYLRVKMKFENNFASYCDILPRKGDILDLGCGYGYITYMLSFTSVERRITGVDYDGAKIRVAQHAYIRNENISFIEADVSDYPFTPKDAFLLGDVLHYLSYERQKELLEKCIHNLRPGGMILVREGNSEAESRHSATKFTEFLSTRLFVFNKTAGDDGTLFFTSSGKIKEIAEAHGLSFEIIDQKKVTSNNFFVMRMPGQEINS